MVVAREGEFGEDEKVEVGSVSRGGEDRVGSGNVLFDLAEFRGKLEDGEAHDVGMESNRMEKGLVAKPVVPPSPSAIYGYICL